MKYDSVKCLCVCGFFLKDDMFYFLADNNEALGENQESLEAKF